MKNKGHNFYILAVAFLMLPIFASCRTEICYNHFPVAAISLSWEKEWERDYGMAHLYNWDGQTYGIGYDELKPGMPEWVNMLKFAEDGTSTEHFLSTDGGDVTLEEDADYSFLLYNGDTEYIVFSDIASLPAARASATSRTRAPIAYIMDRHPGLSSTNPPDILYSAFVKDVPHIGVHETKQVHINMQPLVFTYLIRFEFEYGLQHVALARGALAGMAESVYLRDGRTSDESTIILYDCELKDYGCESKVKSFGIPGFPDKYYGRSDDDADSQRHYTLNLEVLLKNGKTLEFNFDVDDQLQNQPKGGVVTVKGIRIEDEQNEPEQTSGTFDVDLSGWGNPVDVDLPVGEKKD